jgi:membrane associated rhomboid family serine protease
VSWVGHAGGFIGGVLAAFAIRRDSDELDQIKGS